MQGYPAHWHWFRTGVSRLKTELEPQHKTPWRTVISRQEKRRACFKIYWEPSNSNKLCLSSNWFCGWLFATQSPKRHQGRKHNPCFSHWTRPRDAEWMDWKKSFSPGLSPCFTTNKNLHPHIRVLQELHLQFPSLEVKCLFVFLNGVLVMWLK